MAFPFAFCVIGLVWHFDFIKKRGVCSGPDLSSICLISSAALPICSSNRPRRFCRLRVRSHRPPKDCGQLRTGQVLMDGPISAFHKPDAMPVEPQRDRMIGYARGRCYLPPRQPVPSLTEFPNSCPNPAVSFSRFQLTPLLQDGRSPALLLGLPGSEVLP